MQIGFLGPLQVGNGIQMRPRTRTVLAALGVQRQHVVSPGLLAQAVWGDSPPSSWTKQVQICVWDLRKAMGAEVVQSADGGYRLSTQAELDVDRFEALARRGHDLAGVGDADRAASAYHSALDLWRGRPFEDLTHWAPGVIEAARLDELRRNVQEDLLEARLAAGEHRGLVADAEAQVAEEPLRERRWALLALAQYRSGNQGGALRTLRRARQMLIAELGLDPGAELVALEVSILGQDTALLAGERALASATCPYKGLAPYDAVDADTFFGRDPEIAICLDRLERLPLLVLAGPSGCGKSSLARAGLAPALRRRGADVLVMVPGADPDAALSAVLAAAPGNHVIVVDQLEEVFAGSRSLTEVSAFCVRLATYAGDGGKVLATIRSDYLGDLAAQPTLARLVEQGLHLVAPLKGPGLRATVEGPASAAGLRLEPGLVELLVREADDEPGALPLLSHALVETWERRDGRVLTVEGYLATGEIHGAVARSAERLYQSLASEEQDRLRALMLRLVVPSAGGSPVRIHLDASRLSAGAERDRLLELLVRSRLLTADDATVQLAHEALATAWPRLRSWVEDDAAGLQLVQHLSRAADEWQALGYPGSELYRGVRLDAAQEWRSRVAPELAAAETAFLDASVAADEAERRALIEQTASQARQNRRLRFSLVGVALLLVLASLAGVVAVTQRQEARDEGRAAAITALTSEAFSLRTSRRDLAALLAVQAHRLRPDAESEAALFGTFTSSPGVERIVHTGLQLGLTVGDVEYLPDGETVAIGDANGGIQLRNMSSGDVHLIPAISDRPGWPVFDVADGGRYLAAAWRPTAEPETGVVTVWDLATDKQRFAPVTVDFRIGDVALAADGSTLVISGGEQGRVQIHDGATGALRRELPTLGRPDNAHNYVKTAALGFTPDGRLVVGSQAGPIRIVDPTSGTETSRLESGPETSEVAVLVSADGRTMVTAGYRSVARFDLETGEQVWRRDAAAQCNAYAVAERRGAILCGEWSGRVTAVDLATGTPLGAAFDSQLGDVCAVSVSSAGDRLVEVSGCFGTEVTLVEWRLDGGGPVSQVIGQTPTPASIDLLDGHSLVVDYPDGNGGRAITQLIDAATGTTEALPGLTGLLPTDDPKTAVAIYDDGTSPARLGLYDVSGRTLGGPLIDPGIGIEGLWSNGQLAVVTCCGGPPQQVRTVDLQTGEDFGWSGDLPAGQYPSDMVLIGDEAYVAWSDENALIQLTIQRRDLRTATVLATSPPGYQSVAANGGRVVAATTDGRIAELDPVTLQPTGPPFPGTNGPLLSLAIDGAGHRLLVRAADQSLRLYDIPTRTPLGDPIDTATDADNAALRADGMMAAAAAREGIISWDLDPAHWESAACRLAGRNLSQEEWDRYIGALAGYAVTCPQYPAG